MCGNSATHGPHQLAQKSSSTALPLSDCSSTLFPSRSCSAKAIASLPTRLAGRGAAGRGVTAGRDDDLSSATSFAPSGGTKAKKVSGISPPTLARVKTSVIFVFIVFSHGALVLVCWISRRMMLRLLSTHNFLVQALDWPAAAEE